MSIDPIAAAGSATTTTPADRVAVIKQAAFNSLKAETSASKVTFDPAPALRPTIQDRIEIDRALLALHKL